MSDLIFNAVLLYGDDRGSVNPFRSYVVNLPAGEHAGYLGELSEAYWAAMENVGCDLGEYRGFWVEAADEYLDESEQQLRRDNYPENGEQPAQAPADVSEALPLLVTDTLASRAFADTFADEEELVDKSAAELLAASRRKRPVPEPEPVERIALGTPCYRVDSKSPYGTFGTTWEFAGPERYTTERDYVPVSAVEAYVGKIEAYPLPKVLDKRNRWWARPADAKTLEAIAPRRADAIRSARIRAAHKQFWAS